MGKTLKLGNVADSLYETYIKNYFKNFGIELPKNILYQYAYHGKIRTYSIEIAKKDKDGKGIRSGYFADPKPGFVFIGDYDTGFLIASCYIDIIAMTGAHESYETEDTLRMHWERGRCLKFASIITYFDTKDKSNEQQTN